MATSFGPGAWTIATFAAWFLVSYLYHGLGITLGYHRLLTHKSVKVPRWLMYVIVSGGYLCMMGSPIVWVGVHRLHHQKSDQPGDPHSPRDGFWHAMFGWMFGMRDVQTDEELQKAAGELMDDRFFRLLGIEHKPYQAQLCFGVNVVLRLIAVAFVGWIPVLANTLAMLIVFVSTQCVNAVCHLQTAGYRLFDTYEDSRNVWWVAILTLGEGWHNNHHALPKSARHGLAWWEVDVTYISIRVLEMLGLCTNVIIPPASRMPWYKKPAVAVAQQAAAAQQTVAQQAAAAQHAVVQQAAAAQHAVAQQAAAAQHAVAQQAAAAQHAVAQQVADMQQQVADMQHDIAEKLEQLLPPDVVAAQSLEG